MRLRSARPFAARPIVLLFGSALSCSAILAWQFSINVNAQTQSQMQAREWALTHIPDEINKHFKKEQISLFAQIREDFTRLQLMNNEMMQIVFVEKKLDRNLIIGTSAEINKRAVRLSANLVLPRIDDKAKKQKPDDALDDRSLLAELLLLDRCIMSFTTNPLFKQPNVVDAQLALKARRDLDLIIRLSKQLKTGLGNQYPASTSLVGH